MICKLCQKEFNTYASLVGHIISGHKLKSKEYYDKYLKKENEGICCECNKETKFLSLRQGYSVFCSCKCSNGSKLHKEKQKQTYLERYGVENVFQNEEIKEKIKQTNLEKYGVENLFQSKEIQNKIKQTNLMRYGTKYPLKNKEIQNKIKQTNLEKYGVENPFQNNDIKEKIKQTNLMRYGTERPAQNNEIQDKMKETLLKKYGVENYKHSNEYKEKQKQETIEKYRNEFPFLKIIDYDINKKIMSCYCDKCNKNYDINLMLLGDRIRYRNFKNPCTNCFKIGTGDSNQEKELVEYIKSIYTGEIIKNDRNIIKPQELDIYLPEKKIAFEFNGLYWHSLQYKNKEYHLNKTIECEKQGIQLVHIFENEWLNNKNEIKEYIKDLINDSVKVEKYNLIFKKQDNKIIVDRSLNNGKILEDKGYILTETLEPKNKNIFCNDNYFNICDCGQLIYKNKL